VVAAAAAAPSAPLGVGAASDIIAKYNLMCEVGEGTYGVVYKAELRAQPGPTTVAATTAAVPPSKRAKAASAAAAAAAAASSSLSSVGKVAIKKFRATKDGEGISLTACREIGLLKELNHENVLRLLEVILNPREKSLFLVFDYAEFDLFGIIRYHRDHGPQTLPDTLVKSTIWQILNGINYLHANWGVCVSKPTPSFQFQTTALTYLLLSDSSRYQAVEHLGDGQRLELAGACADRRFWVGEDVPGAIATTVREWRCRDHLVSCPRGPFHEQALHSSNRFVFSLPLPSLSRKQ
jgi:hypothetical protein